MFRIASIIFSYNDPVRVLRCYGELLRTRSQFHDVLILDNSADGQSPQSPQTPDTIYLGSQNIGHGGMIDRAVGIGLDNKYGFVGMLNCDTWGYRKDFILQMRLYMNDKTVGMISPSIIKGSVWPTMAQQNHGPHPRVRDSNFIETIAPYYSRGLLTAMAELCPFEKYGYVDRALSVLSLRAGFKNRIVDATGIYHDAGEGMAAEARADLQNNWRDSLAAWLAKHPVIADTLDMWPEDINNIRL